MTNRIRTGAAATREIAAALSRCTFLPASWDKRFARDAAAIAESGNELSERQVAHLLRLSYKYRRQLPTEIIALALDEMEREADRRVAEGKPALPDFTRRAKTKPPLVDRQGRLPI